jgi:hypothetical protein
MKRASSLVAVGTAALLVGATVGPTVAQAASASLVHLEGGGSTHLAKVNSQGQLSVTDGTAHTSAGQLQATVASAGQAFVKIVQPNNCAAALYTVPKGKALIITSLVFFNHAVSTTSQNEQDLFVGQSGAPCTTLVAAGADAPRGR